MSMAVDRLQQTRTESSGARATGARPAKVFVTDTILLACVNIIMRCGVERMNVNDWWNLYETNSETWSWSQKGDGLDNDNVFLLSASVSFFFHYKVTWPPLFKLATTTSLSRAVYATFTKDELIWYFSTFVHLSGVVDSHTPDFSVILHLVLQF